MANTGRFKIDPDTGELAPAYVVEAKRCRKLYGKQSDLAAPMIIHDNVEVQSQADGLWYSSKSTLRKSYKARGMVEVGDYTSDKRKTHTPPKKSRHQRRREIRDSVRKATAQLGFDTV